MNKRMARLRRGEGSTLVEIMVALSLFSVLTIALITVGVYTSRVSTNLGIRLDNANQGEIGVSAASKVLRSANKPDVTCIGCADNAVISATPTYLQVYSQIATLGSKPSRVTLQVVQDPTTTTVSGMLTQNIQPATLNSNGTFYFCDASLLSCPSSNRVITRGLSWPAVPTFAYYDYNGVALTNTPLTSVDRYSLTSLDVVLTVQMVPGQTQAPAGTTLERIRLSDINRPL